MNIYFQHPDNERINIGREIGYPNGGFGLIDSIESSEDGRKFTYAIDIIDEDWLIAFGREKSQTTALEEEALSTALQILELQVAKNEIKDLFERARIYRIEVTSEELPSWIDLQALPEPGSEAYDTIVSQYEQKWLNIQINHNSNNPNASLYRNMFEEPIPVLVHGRLPSKRESIAISKIFNLKHLPTITTGELKTFLRDRVSAKELAVYDVGHGNSNGLLTDGFYPPSCYFDLGVGVHKNYHTRPTGLKFCFSGNQPVILSHWDMDHWAGACVGTYTKGKSPIDSTWIVPSQVVTPIHTAFAYTVATLGGKVFVYSPASKTQVGIAKLQSGEQIKFGLGTGPDKNGSGIVLVIERTVEDENNEVRLASWILTGDCDYGYFLSHMKPANPVAMVVPHHGAQKHTKTLPPIAHPVMDYSRLVYSFGTKNRNGPTNVQHPVSVTVTDHTARNWKLNNWNVTAPGTPLPGGGTLATNEHVIAGQRGGVLIGWNQAPTIYVPPCHFRNCNAPLNQV